MAIVPTTAGMPVDGSSTNGSSFVTAAVVLTAGKLYLLWVWSTVSASGNRAMPVVTHNVAGGGTFDRIGSTGDLESANRRTSLFRCMPGSTTGSGTLTIDFGGLEQTGCAWVLLEVTGIDVSGANGAGAIAQVEAAISDVANITSTFDAGITAGDAVFGGVGSSAGNGSSGGIIAPGPTHGYTELAEDGYNVPNSAIQVQWKEAGTQDVDWTIAAGNHRAVTVEVKPAGGAPPPPVPSGWGVPL